MMSQARPHSFDPTFRAMTVPIGVFQPFDIALNLFEHLTYALFDTLETIREV
jgi:hypothetical protein